MDFAGNVAYLDHAERLASNFPWSIQKKSRGHSQKRIKFGQSQGALLGKLDDGKAASNGYYSTTLNGMFSTEASREPGTVIG